MKEQEKEEKEEKEAKQKSLDALESAALKAIRLGYLDLASQIMFVAEMLALNDKDNVVELPPIVLTMKRDVANLKLLNDKLSG